MPLRTIATDSLTPALGRPVEDRVLFRVVDVLVPLLGLRPAAELVRNLCEITVQLFLLLRRHGGAFLLDRLCP